MFSLIVAIEKQIVIFGYKNDLIVRLKKDGSFQKNYYKHSRNTKRKCGYNGKKDTKIYSRKI